MSLQWIDWLVIILYFVMVLVIGLLSSKQAGKSSAEFFLSGRNMPWWLLGLSMVATTFSTDTPNLVTDIVRTNGVSGNWVWWAFLPTGMMTVFIPAPIAASILGVIPPTGKTSPRTLREPVIAMLWSTGMSSSALMSAVATETLAESPSTPS